MVARTEVRPNLVSTNLSTGCTTTALKVLARVAESSSRNSGAISNCVKCGKLLPATVRESINGSKKRGNIKICFSIFPFVRCFFDFFAILECKIRFSKAQPRKRSTRHDGRSPTADPTGRSGGNDDGSKDRGIIYLMLWDPHSLATIILHTVHVIISQIQIVGNRPSDVPRLSSSGNSPMNSADQARYIGQISELFDVGKY